MLWCVTRSHRLHRDQVRVAFLFDPHQPYAETAILASIDTDYVDALRDALARHLLPKEKLVPRTPTKVVSRQSAGDLPRTCCAPRLHVWSRGRLDGCDLTPNALSLGSQEEILWESVMKRLPDRVLAESVFSDKAKLDEFIDMTKKKASAIYE